MSSRCEYCEGDGECPSIMGSWLCTRNRGHAGDHVACAGRYGHRHFQWPNNADTPTPPPGYEIVGRDVEPGAVIGRDWLVYGPDGWESAEYAEGRTVMGWIEGDWTAVARPIRDPAPVSPWVRASERQPSIGELVQVREIADRDLPYNLTQAFSRRRVSERIRDNNEWLDLKAVDRLAAENEKLREELVNEREISGARIAKLEAERDAIADQLILAHEQRADARAVAERAENAARDAADRLAAYATPRAPVWD